MQRKNRHAATTETKIDNPFLRMKVPIKKIKIKYNAPVKTLSSYNEGRTWQPNTESQETNQKCARKNTRGKNLSNHCRLCPRRTRNDAQMFLSSLKSQKGKETMNKTAEVCVTAMSS